MATVRMPSSWAARNTRMAISLRLATSSLVIFGIKGGGGANGEPGEQTYTRERMLQSSFRGGNREVYAAPKAKRKPRITRNTRMKAGREEPRMKHGYFETCVSSASHFGFLMNLASHQLA